MFYHFDAQFCLSLCFISKLHSFFVFFFVFTRLYFKDLRIIKKNESYKDDKSLFIFFLSLVLVKIMKLTNSGRRLNNAETSLYENSAMLFLL